MRLQGALDNEIAIAVQKFLEAGVPADVSSLYTALQKSNSSLKRKQKKVIQASIERVLEFIDAAREHEVDSDAEIEDIQPAEADASADIMNKALRANLTGRPNTMAPNPVQNGSDGTNMSRKPNGESMPKRQRRNEPQEPQKPALPEVSIEDIGGMDEVIDKMICLLAPPLVRPDFYIKNKTPMPKGVMLHGPPGCGKTMLARALAGVVQCSFIEILGPSIVSGMSGESEKGVREKFEEAKKNAPSLMFIDEIDAIAPKRDSANSSQMEKRIVAQLLVSMDDVFRDPSKPVIVLAATNRPDSIDPALRRGGRFGTEIDIGVPNEKGRQRILEVQTQNMAVSSDVDFLKLAKMTAGFVGSDLYDLVGQASAHQTEQYYDALVSQAIDLGIEGHHKSKTSDTLKSSLRFLARLRRDDIPEPAGFEDHAISMNNFLSVLPGITPSGRREGFTTVPNVSWRDIGALSDVREELKSAIVDPIEKADLFAALGRTAPSGVLLWGPPGCGKTLLAKAVAAESKANFIAVKGPELLNKFVGESEAAVRKLFLRAKSSTPCIIFFDELDALVPRRDNTASEATTRVVNTLLTELDGLNSRAGIFVVAATNRPDMIDEALIRPGRFGTQLFVDVPGAEERVEILHTLTRARPCEFTAEMAQIARNSQGFTGADLEMLVNEAITSAFKRNSRILELQDFEWAIPRVKGSVRDVEHYHRLKKKFGQR